MQHTHRFLFVALLLAIGGCGHEDEATPQIVDDEAPSSAEPDVSHGAQSEDKALRKDYCCVDKKGDRVLLCSDVHRTKIGAANACSAALSDNVVRDGKCSKYATCKGKIREPAEDFGFDDVGGPVVTPRPWPFPCDPFQEPLCGSTD